MTVCSKDRIKLPSFVLFLGILLLLASCRKNEDTVGSDFIEGIVGFDEVSSDSMTIEAYTTLNDSLPTRTLSYYMLGGMNDPELGVSSAGMITQMDLPTQNYDWASANITIDSIVLQVCYAAQAAYYGNRNSAQTIKVYELTEKLSADDANYFSNKTYATGVTPIGTWTGTFSEDEMGDSVTYTYDGAYNSSPAHIRIRLNDPTFVEKFKNSKQGGHFVSTTDFQNYLNGFLIMPDVSGLASGNGAVAYMNMNSSVSRVIVYYKSSGGDLERADFPMYNSTCIRANKYVNSFLPSVSVQPLKGGAYSNINYLKSMAGLKTRLFMPHLFNYIKDRNIAITGAQLVIPIDKTRDTSVYKVPASIRVVPANETGTNNYYIKDLSSVADFAYYGGFYDAAAGEYRFNIIRHVQSILNEYKNNNNNINYGLNLITPTDLPINANRVILDTNPGKVKLKLTYTVIK